MRITFELESADLERFQGAFDRARQLAVDADEIDVIDAAKQALDAICIDKVPAYVRKRLVHVQRLILLLEDDEWQLPMPDRADALAALTYFGDPDDLIPDHIEVIGLIDDAIMLELLARRMRHVLSAYKRFCLFRNSLESAVNEGAERIARACALAKQRAVLVEELLHHRGRVEQLA
ncbi:MAG: YkvA family protein [Dokdonella sp.]|uniref:YkvA family protein n=1 Tax=Dokdonella sp. TaxID=2291710 RepID=UPI002CC90F22|nr:YkvA family protein [Dokdonella sp.]HOX70750.1 YkvA family protein [Dokdonella sp.]HPG94682.1 YkvA family protein [Dokdonella sp.]HPN80756.1 YkvA family protein [Dokdonella sp.]